MTDKELKRLSRAELLELLVNQVRENEALSARVEELTAQLKDRTIKIRESGSIAEAALKLSGIFETADEAAGQYLANHMQQARERCAEMKQKASEECAQMVEETRNQCAQLLENVQNHVAGQPERDAGEKGRGGGDSP